MQKFFEDRHRLFWLLHTLGWVGFALISYLGSLFQEMRSAYWIVVALDAYAGWLLTIPLRYAFQRVWHWEPWKMLLSVLAVAILIAAVWTVFRNFNYWEIYRHGVRPDSWTQYFRQTTVGFYVLLSWSGLYFGIKYYQTLQQEKQKSLTASNKAHEAQLKMLRYQLNPHFLFNTLNAISTLVLLKESDTANKMLVRLSDFLRYSLYKDPIKKVPLQQELYAANLYLEIEKVRFSERLTIIYDIDEAADQALVPSLILQPLVENAIKYAVSELKGHARIEIEVTQQASVLLLKLSDNGPGTELVAGWPDQVSFGSLHNLAERLALLFHGKASLNFSQQQNKFTGQISLPLELLHATD